jgi:hypothetical protein
VPPVTALGEIVSPLNATGVVPAITSKLAEFELPGAAPMTTVYPVPTGAVVGAKTVIDMITPWLLVVVPTFQLLLVDPNEAIFVPDGLKMAQFARGL